MNDANINKGYSNFVVVLLLLFPVVISTVKIFGNLILLILVLLGIYVLFTERKSPFKIPELKLFSWLTMGYFIVMLFSIVQNEGFVDDLYHLGRKAHFALAPLIALAIYRVKLPFNKLLSSIKLGLIIIGAIILYQNLILGMSKPSGMFNANIFGDLVLTMSFFSLVNLFEEKGFTRLLTVISSSLGVYTVVLSGNRGTFLILVILTIIYLLIIFKKYFEGKTKDKIIISLTSILIIFTLSSHDNIYEGFKRAQDSIKMWSTGESNITSAGMRLEMWSGSIEAFKQSPWLGHGYRSANAAVSNFTDPKLKETISAFTHLHNEYITNLISAGVVGLLSVLLLLFLPLKICINNINNKKTFIYSFMGVILCSSYAFIGMTHIAFGEEHMNALYIFFLAILLPNVIKESNSLGLGQPKTVNIAN